MRPLLRANKNTPKNKERLIHFLNGESYVCKSNSNMVLDEKLMVIHALFPYEVNLDNVRRIVKVVEISGDGKEAWVE